LNWKVRYTPRVLLEPDKKHTNGFTPTQITVPFVPSRSPSTPRVDVSSTRPTSLRSRRARVHDGYLIFQRIQLGKRLYNSNDGNVDV
jgi:hypothetical protein